MLEKIKRIRFLIDDFNIFWYLFFSAQYRKLYSHIWCRLNVRDVDGGLLDILYRKFPRLLKRPSEVEFEITTRCGLRCVMCEHTYWDHTSYAKQDITFKDIRKIVEPWTNLKYVGIQGMGNPFLNKEFRQIIRYLDDKGIFINVVENFCEVKDEDMETIVRHVNRIDLSLDAVTKELYESIRPGSNFDGVERNLKKCVELKKRLKRPFPTFFVRIVAFKENYTEIEKIIKFVGDLDLNQGGNVSIEISGLLVFDKIADLVGDSVEAPKEIIEKCIDTAKKYPNIRLKFARSKENPPVESCAKWVQPFVMANGDVVFDCGVMMSDNRLNLHSETFGNIIEKSIDQIWQGKNYAEMRENVNNIKKSIPAPCATCRSFDAGKRAESNGIVEFDKEYNRQFCSNKTSEIIASLKEPPRIKKILQKDELNKSKNQ